MEDNLKKIISETSRLCREQGFQVDAALVAYLASLQEVAAGWQQEAPDASLRQALSPAVIGRLSAWLVRYIKEHEGGPVLATARLQVGSEAVFQKQQRLLEQEAADKMENVDMALRAITGPRPVRENTIDAYQLLYNRMREYVCIKSGLERASSDDVGKEEVRAAMESVFPMAMIARYLTLEDSERIPQMEELARITLGIILYNHHTGAGGAALGPGTQTYLPKAHQLLREIQTQVDKLKSDVGRLEAGGGSLAELMYVYQAVQLFEGQAWDLTQGLEAVQALEAEVQATLHEASSSVSGNAAVSKDLVFPLFERLGEIHTSLTQELRMLVVRQRIFDDMQQLLSAYSPMKGRGQLFRPDPPAEVSAAPSPEALPDDLEYIHPDQAVGVELALSGFCPVALHDGTLRPADPNIGFVRNTIDGCTYGFSDAAALSRFAEHEGEVAAGLDSCIAATPLLIKLLHKQGDYPPDVSCAEAVRLTSQPLKCDFGTQTPVHFVEKHIDYKYEWNEWALRRRALALANLRNKRTHSTQTHESHFKRDNTTQVWRPKEATVQTRVNKGQSMPKKLQYVAGIRGAPAVKMNVVRLDLDLGQPHQH